MKIFASLILSVCSFLNSCAQQKYEKPPKSNKKELKDIKPTYQIQKGHLVLNLGQLKQNEDILYCWETDGKCRVIDGKITLFTHYQTSGDDNPKLIPYNYAEGEFLEGKYQGIWKYYDKNGNVIKKEKWDNGRMIYRKEFK